MFGFLSRPVHIEKVQYEQLEFINSPYVFTTAFTNGGLHTEEEILTAGCILSATAVANSSADLFTHSVVFLPITQK